MDKQYKIAVIGAGLAGIAAALRLRKQGHEVIVFEKNAEPGGKLAEFRAAGFRFDKGPSLLTEPWLIDELFELYDVQPKDHFEYRRIPENCRYFFNDGTKLKLTGDVDSDVSAIEKWSDAASAVAYKSYLERSEQLYGKVGTLFIEEPQPSFIDFLKLKYIVKYPTFLSKSFRSTLHQVNHAAFTDKRLTQLFDRFGTYNGSDPYRMPGLYRMVPHLELNTGTYFPTKGMREIINSLYELANQNSIKFQFNASISLKKERNGYGIQDTHYDKVVCAIDHLTFYKDVLSDTDSFEKYKRQERSTSGLVFFIGLNKKNQDLGLHNIYFSGDYQKEFESITQEKSLAASPTIYVHVSSSVNSADAPTDGQSLFVMVNTPAGVQTTTAYRERVLELLQQRMLAQNNFDLKAHIEHLSYWDCSDIEQLTGSYMGALYGSASNRLNSSFNRHPNETKEYSNLYFCGGTVHPGGGIPLVLRSAKIVAEILA